MSNRTQTDGSPMVFRLPDPPLTPISLICRLFDAVFTSDPEREVATRRELEEQGISVTLDPERWGRRPT